MEVSEEKNDANESSLPAGETLRSVFDNLPGITYRLSVSDDVRLLHLAGDVVTFTGRPPEYFETDPQQRLLECVVPDDQERFLAQFAKAVQNTCSYQGEYRIQTPAGEERWVHERASVRSEDGTTLVDGLILDISEKKKVEHALARSEARYRAIFEHTGEGCLIIDSALVCRDLNAAMSQILGLAPSQSPELCASSFLDDQAITCLKAIDVNSSRSFETELILNDGRRVPCFVNATALANHNADRSGWFVIVRDLTRWAAAQEEIRIARDAAEDASRAKSEFLSNMSHELRTPLNGVLGHTQILLRDTHRSESDRRSLESIRSCGTHLLSLINEVLDLAKIEAGRMEKDLHVVDLEKMLEQVRTIVSQQALAKSLSIEFNVDPCVPRHVTTDGNKLKQILINLMNNAIKFTEDGGVTLRVIEVAPDRFRFSVEDTGPGIDTPDLERIFEPFVQTNTSRGKGGTGLGLTICQRFLAILDSKLDVESRPGSGSVFSFTIDLTEVEDAELPHPSDDLLGDHLQLRIPEGREVSVLIADDREENREILSQLLTSLGIASVSVSNGQEALQALNDQVVDLVLMDVRMPVMNGLEATRRIKDDPRFGSLPVIAVSASVFANQQRRVFDSGYDDFLAKPLRLTELAQKLSHHLAIELTMGPRETESNQSATVPLDRREANRIADVLLSLTRSGDIEQISNFVQELDGPEFSVLAGDLRARVAAFDLRGIRIMAEELLGGDPDD